MRTFGRVGPSIPVNTLPGGRLRIFACCFLHRSEFLKMDESYLQYEPMSTKVTGSWSHKLPAEN